MPHELDDIDVAIVTSLQEDGRKSFRQIARELDISTPTVQARYQRLVNIGLIKSISPIIDSTNLAMDHQEKLESCSCHEHQEISLETGMHVKMKCDFCEGPISDRPQVFKFANYERFFCCNTCKSQYKEKNKGRIQSLIEKARQEN